MADAHALSEVFPKSSNGTELSKAMIDAVRAVDGEFVSLWHNESFSETGRWKNWRKVYEDVLAYATDKSTRK